MVRLRNIKNAESILENSSCFIDKIDEGTFGNDNEVHLEIGVGKGDFIVNKAKENPLINFIGIDRHETLIAKTINKLEKDLPNLKLLKADAKDLEELISIKVNTVYLNFSDPWPKNRHFKRRLTYKDYLDIYKKISKRDFDLFLKTDNINLFVYSLESLSENGFYFKKISLDLHNEDIPNIKTEYERKFSAKGFKINYLHAKLH